MDGDALGWMMPRGARDWLQGPRVQLSILGRLLSIGVARCARLAPLCQACPSVPDLALHAKVASYLRRSLHVDHAQHADCAWVNIGDGTLCFALLHTLHKHHTPRA